MAGSDQGKGSTFFFEKKNQKTSEYEDKVEGAAIEKVVFLVVLRVPASC
jgi:hypothetical protein